jgi:hypothetical protein
MTQDIPVGNLVDTLEEANNVLSTLFGIEGDEADDNQ